MKELNLPDLLGLADPSAHDGITDLWNRKNIHFLVVFTSPDADFEIIGVGPALPCKSLDDAGAHEIPGKRPEFFVKCPAAVSKRLAPKFAPAHLGARPGGEAPAPKPAAPAKGRTQPPLAPAAKPAPAMIAPRTRAPFAASESPAAPAPNSVEPSAPAPARPKLTIKSPPPAGATRAPLPAAASSPPAASAPAKGLSLKPVATLPPPPAPAPAALPAAASGLAPAPAEWEMFLTRLRDLEARERKVFEQCAAQPELFEQCVQALDRREKDLAARARVAQALAAGGG